MASSYTLASQLSGQSDASTAGSSGSFDFQAQWSSNNNNGWCQTGTDSGSSSSRNSSSIAPPWPYATLNNKVFDFAEAGDDRCVATLEAPHGGGGVVSLALDGDLLYSGSDAAAGDIRVWRHNTSTDSHSLTSAGERLRTRGGRGGAVKAMVPVAGGLYSAHQDRKLRVWRREEQKRQQAAGADDSGNQLSLAGTLPTLKDYVVSFLPPSNYVRVRRHHKALWIRHADTVSVLVAGADVLYSASWDKSIKVWRLSDHKCLESLLAHDDAINALAVDQANAFLYSGGADAKIKVWARILPDGSSVPFTTPLATPSTPGQEAEQQENVGRRPLLRSQPSASNLLSPSLLVNQLQPHGRRSRGYMSSPADPKMLQSLEGGIGGKQHHRFKGTSPLHPHARNRHGSHALVATLEGHGSAINSLALSPDAALLYSASGDASISVWEREDSARHMSFAAVLRGHRQAVLSLAVSSPSSSSSQENYLLCSGSADATIRIWRRRHYSQSAHHVCVAVLQGHRGPVKSLALRDNGMFLYSGSMDRDIRVWSLLGLQQTSNKQQKLEERGKASQERDNSGSTFSTPQYRCR